MEEKNQDKPLEIQIALRLKGELAEKIKAMAEEDDRSFAYVAQKLIKERLEQGE